MSGAHGLLILFKRTQLFSYLVTLDELRVSYRTRTAHF